MNQVLVYNCGHRGGAITVTGDVVTILDANKHPGRKIVSTSSWDGVVDYSSDLGRATTLSERQSGEDTDFAIFEVSGMTRQEVRRNMASSLGIAVDLSVVAKIMNVDMSSMSQSVQDDLIEFGRATVSWSEFDAVLSMKDGVTVQEVQDLMTYDGQFPEALTTEFP